MIVQDLHRKRFLSAPSINYIHGSDRVMWNFKHQASYNVLSHERRKPLVHISQQRFVAAVFLVNVWCILSSIFNRPYLVSIGTFKILDNISKGPHSKSATEASYMYYFSVQLQPWEILRHIRAACNSGTSHGKQ